MQSIIKVIDPDMARTMAPDNGCIFSAVQKKMPVSEICGACQLSILRCLYKNDVNTFYLDVINNGKRLT